MGIQGVAKYFNQRADKFARDIELHDCFLVVDGNCLSIHLYYSNRINSCFGGDYQQYAKYVSEYFDDLLKCNITPLVIFDGAIEDRKIKTICKRSMERIKKVSVSHPQNDKELIPLLAKDLFKSILKQKKIKVVQTLFEADNHIASIARILDCPVLSNDSDFYVYDVKYIPYTMLEDGSSNSSSKSTLVKRCKMFKNDFFFEEFPRMDRKCLPLMAALLGNDYIDENVCKQFFSSIQSYDYRQKVQNLVNWLQGRSVNDAIIAVIRNLNPEKKQEILDIIQMIINEYLKLESSMLAPLGFSQEEIDRLLSNKQNDFFEFESSLQDRQCNNKTETRDLTKKSLSDNKSNEEKFKKTIPNWFLQEYYKTNLPPYFLDMLHRQLFVATEQMEDLNQPPCIDTSLKIISVIYRLLSSGTNNSETLEYIGREIGSNILKYKLDCSDTNFEYPVLEKLQELPLEERKQILLKTLKVSDQSLACFPPMWKLYLATLKYWMDECNKNLSTKYHLYAFKFLMVHHVIKRVISQSSYFDTRFMQKQNSKTESLSVNMPVQEALEKVTKRDCLNADLYFRSQIHIERCNFNVSVVHAFSIFQTCLKYSMHLNALLGYPYLPVEFHEFLNGVLFYNVYCDLQKYDNLNERVSTIFRDSPSILQLFVSIQYKS